MAKSVSKKHRRMKKTVRKTLGTLFLISALIVAAIPTESLQAAGEGGMTYNRTQKFKVTVSRNAAERTKEVGSGSSIPTMDTIIPEIQPGETIYTTGTNEDGSIYQFAYVRDSGDWAAVLLGYSKNNNLPDNMLTIPDTVNAYIQPTGNLGTGNGYVAASLSGEPLYYEALTEHTRTVTEQAKDADGTLLWEDVDHTVPKMITREDKYFSGEILPCYATDNAWKELDLEQFFYASAGSSVTSDRAEDESGKALVYSGYARSSTTDHQWIKNAAVKYIGNQYLDSTYHADTHTYEWSIPAGGNYIDEATAQEGIFAGAGNIGTLKIGENLIGVGNYAFFNCTGLAQVSFGNGLSVIGNWAFAGCTRMTSVEVPPVSKLGVIGDHAFYQCNALTAITVPVSVRYIGDYAFALCRFLTSVELCDFKKGPSGSVLAELGWNIFEDCETLYSLILPENYSEVIDISLFKGCKSLRYITSRNRNLVFSESDGVYSFAQFKEMLAGEPVNGEFYFEGLSDSALHEFTKEECFTFSYIDYNPDAGQYESRDRYELTVQDSGTSGEDGRSTYVVNSANELIESKIGASVKNLIIPNQIGPYHIYSIGQSIFENNCSLELVTIPRNVQSIASEAFKGCHNMENVIFETDTVSIGKDAFKTQDFTGAMHGKGCKGIGGGGIAGGDSTVPEKKLHFVGTISPESTPFQYAMSYDGRYNNGSQTTSFITYYSGWPTNLTVEYRYDPVTGTGYSELTNFPSFSELSDYAAGNYAYMTDAYKQAASSALNAYQNGASMSEDQQDFIDSALHLEIPRGVQAIKDGLFLEKETKDKAASLGSLEKKVDIYGLDTVEENDFKGCETLTELGIYGDTASIAANAFDGCSKLSRVAVNGSTQSIGDHAFNNCAALEDVTLTASINSLGKRPFSGCEILENVVFQGQNSYTCADSVIYGMSGGSRTKVIECLEGRKSKYIKASELAGVTELAEEAFAGSNVKEVDLTQSSIQTVPSRAFADTAELRTVKLPMTCKQIQDYAFQDSAMDRLEASQYLTLLGQHPFDGLTNPKGDVTMCSPEGSYLYQYAEANGYYPDTVPQVNYYEVSFRDWNAELGKYALVPDATQTVKGGEDAVPPTPAGKEGEVFQYWDPDYREVSDDLICVAIYGAGDPDADKLTVTFKDYDDTVLGTVKVTKGESAADKVPRDPTREGYLFIGWDRDLSNIQESFDTKAQYEKIAEDEVAVRYLNINKEVFWTTTVKKGATAPSIVVPVVEGYTFREWLPDISTKLEKDTDFQAVYDKNTDANGGNGNGNGNGGTGDGGNGGNGNGNGNGSTGDGGNSNGNGNGTTTTKLYTLTVRNGSGSGSYAAGSNPIIIANDPTANQEFANWTVEPTDTKIASTAVTATVITMPEKNVTVTANYKAKTGSGSNSGTATTGSGNSSGNKSPGRPNNSTGSVKNGGTTVVIDKNGLSNTGVVTAVVNGSTDNFTIKVTESGAASEAVVRALMAEYGEDLSNIKYFPMDISLYDSTGQNKITDTSGISVSITLPLPDSLITYAGNNKVAGVVNDRLDKMTPKFTTIQGVSCVTFTAEHFSPYVIYVDTNNLTAGMASDNTPKTGDGIHPKWFLSIGLACIAAVLFMKRDRRVLTKVRA